MKRTLWFGLMALGAGAVIWWAISPRHDQPVSLDLSVAGWRSVFLIGERIPLKLAFRSGVPRRYEIDLAAYDRSGRMEFEQFTIEPADAVVDPLAAFEQGMSGGLTSSAFLGRWPTTVRLHLNEWVWFKKPGTYRVTVSSQRAGVVDPVSTAGPTPMNVTSNAITLRLVAPNRWWQDRVYRKAVRILDSPAPTESNAEDEWYGARERATETLRFLGTPAATRALAQRLRPERYGSVESGCVMGLLASPEKEVARAALEEELLDPDHPISERFLSTLLEVNGGAAARGAGSEVRRDVLEKLVAALPRKRGAALPVSLSTAIEGAWDSGALPKQTLDQLAAQTISLFEQLPQNQQARLLTDRWEKVATPSLLPVLKGVVERSPEPQTDGDSHKRRLIGAALQRWFELDPAGARPVIVREITRPQPRLGALELGFLPDVSLPEADHALAQNLSANKGDQSFGNIAALIGRYATGAILPQVVEHVDARLAAGGCGIQAPLLAYLLRVSPDSARVRIEKALAATREKLPRHADAGSTPGEDDDRLCNQTLFEEISSIYFDPVLEQIAIASLHNPAPRRAADAATMLRKFGSPAVETALWERYEVWSKRWNGRESELSVAFAPPIHDAVPGAGLSQALTVLWERYETWRGRGSEHPDEQSGTSVALQDALVAECLLGRALVEAIVEGRNWFTDRSELERLAGLNTLQILQEQIARYLRCWDDSGVPLYFRGEGFSVSVAQYQVESLDRLREKLIQFPSGTKFVLWLSDYRAKTHDAEVAEIRRLLVSHGMSMQVKRTES